MSQKNYRLPRRFVRESPSSVSIRASSSLRLFRRPLTASCCVETSSASLWMFLVFCSRRSLRSLTGLP